MRSFLMETRALGGQPGTSPSCCWSAGPRRREVGRCVQPWLGRSCRVLSVCVGGAGRGVCSPRLGVCNGDVHLGCRGCGWALAAGSPLPAQFLCMCG